LLTDNFDLAVTCSGEAALQAYLAGIECSLRFDRSGIEELSEALARDEEFALAHAALGRQLSTHGRRAEAEQHFAQALRLSTGVTPREQGAIAVIAAAAAGKPQAQAMAKAHIAAWPRDVFVLAHLLGPFGLLAFSGCRDWSALNIALLDATESAYPSNDWWRLATRGFFEAEQGELGQARTHCERAWSLSENGNCAHSMTHLHFEAGVFDEGRLFIDQWMTDHGAHSDMRHHIVWHLTLLDLEDDVDPQRALARYGEELDPRINDPTPLETLADSASLLWRCRLNGQEVPAAVAEDLARYAQTHFPDCGFAFADLHHALSAALLPDCGTLKTLTKRLRVVAQSANSEAAACVYEFARGLAAFADHSYEEAVALLERACNASVVLGGSNPQRSVIEDTLLEACLRAGHREQARTLVLQRNRKITPFDDAVLEKISEVSNGE